MKNIQSLRAHGDSKVIVDWVIRASTFQVMMLDHWCSSTRSLLEGFNGFSIKHIYRKFNFIANLYKQVVGECEATIIF